MKYLNIILLLITFNTFGQEFITDDNFDSKINQRQAFGDDQTMPVIVEFYAKFNDANKFDDWDKLENVVYYRADIAEAKTLPEPAIDRIEYDLKDELIRQTIMDTQEDLEEIKETIDKIDERLYEIQSKQR